MIRGRELLQIVDALESLNTEAAVRTQIGRLYYAAFLETRRGYELHEGYSRVRMAREHHALADRKQGAVRGEWSNERSFNRGQTHESTIRDGQR